MSWMSTDTINDLQAKNAKLIQAVQEADNAVKDAHQKVRAAEQHLQMCEAEATTARDLLDDNSMLLAIAQGSAPIPNRDAIRVTDEGLGLALGALRIAVLPDGATAEQLHEYAEVMRSLYAAASGLAHRADDAAAAAAERPVASGGPADTGPMPAAEAEPDGDPLAYPEPGSAIPDQPGYVVGRCGHRVAASEWRAGFRVCERCPYPDDTEATTEAEQVEGGEVR